MSEEEMMSLFRAIREQLNRIEARQLQMYERQREIKTDLESEIEAKPEIGSLGRSEIPRERTGH